MIDYFLSYLIHDYTLRIVIQGAGLLGLTAGVLGVVALLRQQSLLGDALSHAALPGIAAMFLITHSKNPWVLLCGGGITGGIGVLLMNFVIARTTVKKDVVLGIVLSVFFGFGLVLMTVVQKFSVAQQSILNKFLFGNVSTLLEEDIVVMKIVSCIVLFSIIVFFKEIKLYLFDDSLAALLGFSTRFLEWLLTVLLLLTIIIGLQTVGVVLMSSMLVAPAAAARQWVSRLSSMMILSGLFGATAGITGAIISSSVDRLPTGPTIVVVASLLVLFSLLFAPHRGILMKRIHRVPLPVRPECL